MNRIDFDKALNPEQRAAATAPDGAMLVLAAAGTGKTRTLVYRVAYLVSSGVAPERILLLTFTNKAAREMLERARELVPAISGVWGGTFHHFANRILRRHAGAIGYQNNYTILDRDDSKRIVAAAVKDLKIRDNDFPKTNVLLSLFGSAANSERPVADIAEERFAEFPVNIDDLVRVHEVYTKRKRALDAMDFDDMLGNCLQLFRENAGLLARYQEQFQHVLVDEYQDTNVIQAELVDKLAARWRNVMVVGDDFQSIYAWRGADFRNIMSFPDRYAHTSRYKLETNYRSVPEILDVANACIRGNPEQYQKTLLPTRESYKRPIVARPRSGEEQARYLASYMREMRREGYRYSDMVVLYRAHFHSMEMQMQLTRECIPYTVTSGIRFFEQAHIKDACSVLRLAVNPEDELAFTRLVALLPRVGERSAAKVWSKLEGRVDSAVPAPLEQVKAALPVPARAGWQAMANAMQRYHDHRLGRDGGEVIHQFVEHFYGDYAVQTFENADRRLDDINELILYTARFETVEDFLSDIALLTNLDAEDDAPVAGRPDQVRLSTVHQAKGLEWPVVMLLWMNEGMFPSVRTLNETDGGEAEERRLFYVAVTRAKDELCMCAPEVRRMRDGGVMPCEKSRFLAELPAGLVRDIRVPFI